MKVVVLADTHLRDPDRRWLPPAAVDALVRADVVLHAGDLVCAGVLERLGRYGPVHAVLGNNDHDLVGTLPDTLVTDLDGVRVGMVHDSGPARGRAARLRRRFPDADVVVFGHSHAPCDETGIAGQLLFNPGSPTQRRAQPRHTIGLLELRRGRVASRSIVAV